MKEFGTGRLNNMFRRHFMQRFTCAGTALFTVSQMSHASERKTVTYGIKGFTCITCAVGLETMLKQQKGVLRAAASYAKANVLIEFDPAFITETSLKKYISDMGFRVDVERAK
jgi:copper chaperone